MAVLIFIRRYKYPIYELNVNRSFIEYNYHFIHECKMKMLKLLLFIDNIISIDT